MLPHALWGSNKRNTKERANTSHATISFYTQKDSHALVRDITFPSVKKQPISRAGTCSMGKKKSQNSFPGFLVQAHKKNKKQIRFKTQ